METYKIVRFFRKSGRRKIMRRGLTAPELHYLDGWNWAAGTDYGERKARPATDRELYDGLLRLDQLDGSMLPFWLGVLDADAVAAEYDGISGTYSLCGPRPGSFSPDEFPAEGYDEPECHYCGEPGCRAAHDQEEYHASYDR